MYTQPDHALAPPFPSPDIKLRQPPTSYGPSSTLLFLAHSAAFGTTYPLFPRVTPPQRVPISIPPSFLLFPSLIPPTSLWEHPLGLSPTF